MCIALVATQPRSDIRRLVLHNRDEFRARAFSDPSWIRHEGRDYFAGIDSKSKGTWLAINRAGDLSFVVNIRRPDSRSAPRSRGELPFLSLENGLERLPFPPSEYGNFNLILIDRAGIRSASNLTSGVNRHSGQVVTFSNHVDVETPWLKEIFLREEATQLLREGLQGDALADALLRLLENRDERSGRLPDTGMPAGLEKKLSSVFIDIPERDYGTVASSVLIETETSRTLWYKNQITSKAEKYEL